MSDFNLGLPRRSPANTGNFRSPDTGVSVADLESAFGALGEEIFLVHRDTGDIVWMSSACKSLTHKLGASSNIAEFPGLRKMVYSVASKTSGGRTQANWYTHDATWEQYIGNSEKSSISVFCSDGNPNNIWVRLTRYSDRDDYMRQYVAEQEELFNTSRSISVGEITTTLAHELNQPLGTLQNIVNGIRSRIDKTFPKAGEILQALELAEKQAHFASEILLKVRSFTRSRQPVMGECDVRQLIDDTVNLLDWKFQAENINVSYNIAVDGLIVKGDITLLQQVLVNLLRNAIESMADVEVENRMIEISAFHQDSAVGIDIRDSGHGIDKNKMDDLFTLFRSNKPNGMGVGLNICLSFIELHRGKFWFTQNDDCGCTAHILIPD